MKKTDYQKRKKEILQENNIKPSQVGKRESFPSAKQAGIEIMLLAGISKRIALAAVYGVQNSPKCNTSAYLTDVWNFCSMYDGFCLDYCIKLADQYFSGNENCEVGMKYPEFEPYFLINKYAVAKTGEFEPNWSKERYKERKEKGEEVERTFYELWENEDRSISFSFEVGRMGKGGYSGATFKSFEAAVQFVEWFINNSQNYVKDIDLFTNRLGGLSLSEVTEIRKESKQLTLVA